MSDPEPHASDLDAPDRALPPSAAAPLLLGARIVIPVALAIVGYAVLIAQRWSVTHELQLVAPEEAFSSVPLRAFVFTGIASDDDVPSLAPADVEVQLICGGRTIATERLVAGLQGSREGVLFAREAIEAACELRASASIAGEVVATAHRPIRMRGSDEMPPPAPLLGRLASELQHLIVGPLVLEVPEAILERPCVRVTHGTCIPEQPCEILIRAPDVDRVSIDPSPAATPSRESEEDGLHVLELIAHGPEASVVLALLRGGVRVAHADLRLPVALATPWIEARRALSGEAAVIAIAPPPGREEVIVDTFHLGRWIETRTVRGSSVGLDARGRALRRLQVRADPFGGEHVAVHYAILGTDPIDPAWVRERLEAERSEILDPEGTPWRMLLASAEEEIRQVPAAVSGIEEDRAAVAARRRRVQIVGGIALALGSGVFLASLLRRGLRAAEEARGVLRAAGDETAGSRATRLRMTFAVLLFVGAVGVALLAGAALVLARAALVAL